MRKISIFAFLLGLVLPIVVYGLVFEEKGVKCISLRMYKDANGGPHANAECDTFDANNSPMSHINVEIWESFSQAQKDALSSAFVAMDPNVRELRQIPEPSPSPGPAAEAAQKGKKK